MRIAVLDDYHDLGPARLDPVLAEWRASKTSQTAASATTGVTATAPATVTYFHDTLPQDTDAEVTALVERLEPFEVICSMRERTPFPATLLARLPNLRLLLTTGTHNRAIDIAAAAEHGIVVAGTGPSKFRNTGTVQHTWALMLALAGHLVRDDRGIAANRPWSAGQPGTLLAGGTLGILGLGQLGSQVARIGVAFGMRIIAWSLNLTQEKADTAAKSAGLAPGTYTVVSREQLFAESDVLSIHLILSSRTRGLVTADDLRKMKPTALIVNTARGALVVEDDLLDALDKGLIAGAAIDVFEQEPLPANSRWRTTPWGTDGRGSVVLTPHSGYAFSDMLDAMWADTAVNVRRVLAGQEPLWRLDGK